MTTKLNSLKGICVFLLLSLTFYSCTKSADQEVTNKFKEAKIDYALVSQVTSMNFSDQKVSYKLLNSAEKEKIWRNRIEEFKKQIGTNLSPEQKLFIVKVESVLCPEIFNEGTSEQKKFLDNQGPELYTASMKLLGRSTTIKLFNELTPLNLNGDEENPDDGINDSCNCNWQNDMCWFSYCNLNSNCTKSDSGCGWWWNQPCNGRC